MGRCSFRSCVECSSQKPAYHRVHDNELLLLRSNLLAKEDQTLLQIVLERGGTFNQIARLVESLRDEVHADSVALTVLDAQRRGWTVKYVAPMDGPCSEIPPPEDYFQQTFMRCQYEYGYQVATGESSPWRDSVDTLPNADAVHGRHPCRN